MADSTPGAAEGPDAALPVAAVLDRVAAALRPGGRAVLQAPPGAGKTTAVPLALLRAGQAGRILMLEPRRVAARAAAERLAERLGERPGATVGYRMRGESRPGRRIEVVTEGVLTRMLQADPELSGIGCVIFDEFHERALQADLGLALTLEAAAALRPDLSLLAMSATLDAGPVAALMQAPVITAEGRAWPVARRWLDTPAGPGAGTGPAFVAAAAELIARAAHETAADPGGDILAFLPGRGEIAAVAARLKGLGAEVVPLHGGLPFARQRAALAPGAGRRIVLATAIAETSLTIPGVRVVVDTGRARRARLDPASGMSRLVTERVTRAEAEQRTGRAGRVAPGVCYRMWAKGEEGALTAFPPPEIETADLAPLALDLAQWGAEDPARLPFLTPPPEGAYAAARALLADLGALAPGGGLTPRGREMAALPVHPRLARMLIAGGGRAAPLAALLEGRDPLTGGARAPADLSLRLAALADPRRARAEGLDRARLADLAAEARRLAARAPAPSAPELSPGALASLAYPDRIALRRPGGPARYLLSGGSGAALPDDDPLAGERLLVAADLDGDRREARIRRALRVTEAEIRALHGDRIRMVEVCEWSRRHRRVEARLQERLGALVLEDRVWPDPPDAVRVPALLDGVRDLGLDSLNWTAAARALQGRALWLAGQGHDLPAMDDAALAAALEDWLAPFLAGVRGIAEVQALDLLPPLAARLGPQGEALLAARAPTHFTAPTGTRVRIAYPPEGPEVALRLQELFGLDTHPTLGPGGPPLTLTLLSPAGRPVQVTRDLAGFWRSSYADVRRDMRGRYPRHPWPEDPLAAAPTARARPRKGRAPR